MTDLKGDHKINIYFTHGIITKISQQENNKKTGVYNDFKKGFLFDNFPLLDIFTWEHYFIQ